MISFQSQRKGPSISPEGFAPFDYKNLKELWSIVSVYTWSPTIFKDNYRLQSNYAFADLIGLDFDNDVPGKKQFTLDDAKTAFSGMYYLIGTTKSHGREKKGIVADRFRVIIKMSERVHCAAQYKYNLERLYKLLNSKIDISCLDVSRQFYPCKHLAYYETGTPWKVLREDPIQAQRKKSERDLAKLQRAWRPLPKRAREFLEHGVMFRDGRNNNIFGVALMLFEKRYSEHEVFSLIKNAPIDFSGISDNEIWDTIRSARRKVSCVVS